MKYRFRVSVTWVVEAIDKADAQSRAERQINCLGMDPEVEFLGDTLTQSLHVDSVGQPSTAKMR